jgi:hypothetical protein
LHQLWASLALTEIQQLTAHHRLGCRISIEFALPARDHHLGESATQLIEPHYGTLSALLLLVGISPLRRSTLPSHRIAAHSASSNYRIQV